jgi:NADH-quinone oxidoreductase subunit K
MTIPLNYFLLISGLLFSIAFFGLLLRRNALVVLMSLELMLNSANIMLVAFSRYHATALRPLLDGHVFVFFIITVAAAEVAVGLAIIVNLYRQRSTVMLHELNALNNESID